MQNGVGQKVESPAIEFDDLFVEFTVSVPDFPDSSWSLQGAVVAAHLQSVQARASQPVAMVRKKAVVHKLVVKLRALARRLR